MRRFILIPLLFLLALPALALAARKNPADALVDIGAAAKTSFWHRHTD